uniref:Uncharacterized protein n=1 Tax=Molossus molossus TaxID=27622 RepID=A0A7J8FZD1_MOLMO|nr:hypothetical protein HJG59_008278 [Molossus molossus]
MLINQISCALTALLKRLKEEVRANGYMQNPASSLLPPSSPAFSGRPLGKGDVAVFLVPSALTWSECLTLPRKAWEKDYFPCPGSDTKPFLTMMTIAINIIITGQAVTIPTYSAVWWTLPPLRLGMYAFRL